jgi:hypothetical protein
LHVLSRNVTVADHITVLGLPISDPHPYPHPHLHSTPPRA